MSHVRRIYMCNVGQSTSWRPPQIQEIMDPEDKAPAFTIIELENGGGKTTDISLNLATFEPSQRRFLAAVSKEDSDAGQARHFHNYFRDNGLPGLVAIEFVVPSTPTVDRTVIVGYAVTRREGEGKGQFERVFFVIEPKQDLLAPDVLLTMPGLDTEGAYPMLHSLRDVRAWLRHMHGREDIVFAQEDAQERWQRLATSHGIDLKLLGMLVDVNRRESSDNIGFFSYKTERDFLNALIGSLFDGQELADNHEHFQQGITKVRSLQPRRAAMDQLLILQDNAKLFGNAARGYAKAEQDKAMVNEGMREVVAGLRATGIEIDARIKGITDQLQALADEREEAYAAYEDAQGRSEGAWLTYHLLTCQAASDRADRLSGELGRARREVSSLVLARHLAKEGGFEDQLADIRHKLQEHEEGLRPFEAAEARARGAFLAVLHARKAVLEEQRAVVRSDERRIQDSLAAVNAGSKETTARLMGLERERNRVDGKMEAEAQARRLAVADGHLAQGESCAAALARIEAQDRAARDDISNLKDLVRSDEQAIQAMAARERQVQDDLKKQGVRQGKLQDDLRREKMLREACNREDAVVRFLEGPIDPALPRLRERLQNHVDALSRKVIQDGVEMQRREQMAKAVESYGVAFDRPDAQHVLDVLHKAGLASARPGGDWLARVHGATPDLARRIVDADPARLDLVVPLPEDLDRARAILAREAPVVLSHVTISVGVETPSPLPSDRIVVSPADDAAWVRASALRLASEISDERQRLMIDRRRMEEDMASFRRVIATIEQWAQSYGPTWIEDTEALLREVGEGIERLTAESAELQDAMQAKRTAIRGMEEAVQAHDRTLRDLQSSRTQVARLQVLESEAADARAQRDSLLAGIEEANAALAALEDQREALAQEQRDLVARASSLGHFHADVVRKIGQTAPAPAPDKVPELSEADAEAEWRRQKDEYDRKRQGIDPALAVQAKNLQDNLDSIRAEIDTVCKDDGITREDGMAYLPKAHMLDVLGGELRARVKSLEFEEQVARSALGAAEAAQTTFIRERRMSSHSAIPFASAEQAQEAGVRFGQEAAAHLGRRKELEAREAQVNFELGDLKRSRETVRIWLGAVPENLANVVPADRGLDDIEAAIARFKTLRERHRHHSADAEKHLANADTVQRRILEQVGSDAFKGVDPMVAENIRTSTLDAMLQNGGALETLVADRIASIQDDVDNLDRQIDLLGEQLRRFLASGFKMLRDVSNVSIPDDCPVEPGQAIVKFRQKALDVSEDMRDIYMPGVIREMALNEKTPRDGAALLVDLILRMSAGDIGTKVLKPTLIGGRYDAYGAMSHSVGEKMSVGMMFFAGIARLRAKALGKPLRRCGVLILDNPLGALTSQRLWETTLSVLKAMDVQMVAYTGVLDQNVHKLFPYQVVMGRFMTPDGAEIHVKPVSYQRKPLPEAA